MTLIVGLVGRDGIVLAADSRGTARDSGGILAMNDQEKKLLKLTNNAGMALSGELGIARTLIDRRLHDAEDCPVESIACVDRLVDDLSTHFWETFSRPFQKVHPPAWPSVNLIVAGYNECHDPRLYTMTLGSGGFFPHLEEGVGYVFNGVPHYASLIASVLYHHDLSIHSLSRLAAFMISETAAQHPTVGGPIRIATITPDNGYVELPDDVVVLICQRNNEQRNKLRIVFFEGDV